MITKLPLVIDISHWKAVPDFNALIPRPFLIITKATEHVSYTDATFTRYFAAMRAAGYLRGAYHFFRKAYDAATQARHFIQTLNPYIDPDDILVLDVEEGGETAAQLLTFLDLVVLAFPSNIVMLYGRKNLLDPIPMTDAQKRRMKAFPIWTAGYPVNADLYETVPSFYIPDQSKYGPVWLWQYSNHGDIGGIAGDTDVNWIHPTLYDLISGSVTLPPVVIGETMQGKVKSFTNLRYDKNHTSADLGDLLAGDIVTYAVSGTGTDGLTYHYLTDATRGGVPVRRTDGRTVAEANCWAYAANIDPIEPPAEITPPSRVLLEWDDAAGNVVTRKTYIPE
jgi:lysozyme